MSAASSTSRSLASMIRTASHSSARIAASSFRFSDSTVTAPGLGSERAAGVSKRFPSSPSGSSSPQISQSAAFPAPCPGLS